MLVCSKKNKFIHTTFWWVYIFTKEWNITGLYTFLAFSSGSWTLKVIIWIVQFSLSRKLLVRSKEALSGRVDGRLIVRDDYCSSIGSSYKRNKYFLTGGWIISRRYSIDLATTECKSQGRMSSWMTWRRFLFSIPERWGFDDSTDDRLDYRPVDSTPARSIDAESYALVSRKYFTELLLSTH